jgi:hypothetical protein
MSSSTRSSDCRPYPALQSAASSIDNIQHGRQRPNTNLQSDKTLHISWQFHPEDINKDKIHHVVTKC